MDVEAETLYEESGGRVATPRVNSNSVPVGLLMLTVQTPSGIRKSVSFFVIYSPGGRVPVAAN